MSTHTIVWIDHKEARIFRLQPQSPTEATVHAPHFVHRHPNESDRAKDHPDGTRRFFQEVAQVLSASEQLIVVGPSTAKLEFLRYLHKHDHLLESKVLGIETMDHPTDNQLIAFAKQYFNLGGRPTPP